MDGSTIGPCRFCASAAGDVVQCFLCMLRWHSKCGEEAMEAINDMVAPPTPGRKIAAPSVFSLCPLCRSKAKYIYIYIYIYVYI